MKIKVEHNWDYDLPKNFKPKNEQEWLWLLERKINYDDFKGLKRKIVKKHFFKLKKRLDPGKRKMLEYFFKKYGRIK